MTFIECSLKLFLIELIEIRLKPWETLITLAKVVGLQVISELFALYNVMDNLDKKGNNMRKRKRKRQGKIGEAGVLFFCQSPQSY